MRPVRNLLFTLVFIIMFTGLAAASVNVTIFTYPSQTTVGVNANLSVQVLDNGSHPVNNTLINFTTTLGNLSMTSAYTNPSGIATIMINSTASGNAMINASVGIDYNTTNVSFLPGNPELIAVNVTQNPLVVGNTTTVNLKMYDQYNNINSTAYMDINISITDVLGNLMNLNFTKSPFNLTELQVNSTDVIPTDNTTSSPGVILLINSTLAGLINVTASSNNITNSTNITFIPAEVYDFNVYCDGTTCTRVVNQTVNMTVESIDVYGNPLNDTVVYFNTSAPPSTEFNSPIEYNSLVFTPNISTTHINGTTSTVFRTDKRAGDNTIYISAGSVNKSYIIPGEADVPSNMFLSQSPDIAFANNIDVYRLTAQVTDHFQNPVLPEGVSLIKKVHFISSSQTYVLLNEIGEATTLVGPTLYNETINISAIYNDGANDNGSIMNSTNLSFVPGNLSRFVFYANPDTVLYQNGTGNHNSSIILVAIDEWGHPIPNINVKLNNTNSTLGTLTVPYVNGSNVINAITDQSGEINALFVSNISVGNATITAENSSIISSLNISIKDKAFISVSVDFEPKSIISGQIVNVSTNIAVEGDIPVTRQVANAMLVLDNTGSMDPDYYAGTPADILLVSDDSGSMSTNNAIDAVRKAEVNFTNNLVSNDRIGLETFNGTIIGNPSLSRNVTYIQNQINSQGAGGLTPTAKAIQNAKNYLVANPRQGALPIIILLSDGLPTQSLYGGDPTFEAINESYYAKKTMINNNYIKIYTIYFNSSDTGNSGASGIDTLKAIASPDSSYYSTPQDVENVFENIAQQISDFDISTRQYGTDGFTPYNYMRNGSVNNSKPWLDNISLDDNVTDFKVQIDNPGVNFTLNYNGTTYPKANESGLLNRTGYYNVSKNDASKGRYIWIEPVNNTYDPDQDKTIVIPRGNWTINITTKNASNVTFNVTTYIDKISAAKIASHAFLSSFDATRGDRAGLVTYSNIPNPPNTTNSTTQSSYLLNGSTWDGYFVGSTPKKNYTLNFTGTGCSHSYNGFGQCYIMVNGNYAASFSNNSIHNYSVDITNNVLNGSNTVSFYDYYCMYKSCSSNNKSYVSNVTIFENGNSIFQNNSNKSLGNNPTSYIFNASFNTTFNLTWPNATGNLDFYIYRGGTLLNKSTGTGIKPKTFKATIYPDKDYYVEVNATNISSETNFTINASQMLTWNSYTANVTAPLEVSNQTQSFDLLNTSIDTMDAVGLTAIDEGLYEGSNQFSNNSVHPTLVLMTDGLDNAGYRSLLNELNRSKNNGTVIYTIGLGNNQSEIDPVLSQIANTTGGQYYFAPNTTVLKSIFKGIASGLTKFEATSPTLNLLIPNNYISGNSVAKATYIANSSNITTNNGGIFVPPTYPGNYTNEPNKTSIGNVTLLSWPLPNLTVGDKWGLWYQVRVEGAGYVPLILSGSNITYLSMENNSNVQIIINIVNSGGSDVGGSGAGVSYVALGNLLLSANPSVISINEPSTIIVSAKYVDGNPAIANVTLYSDLGYFNGSLNPYNMIASGSGFVNFTSPIAGQANINAIGSNGNNSVLGSEVVIVKSEGGIIVS